MQRSIRKVRVLSPAGITLSIVMLLLSDSVRGAEPVETPSDKPSEVPATSTAPLNPEPLNGQIYGEWYTRTEHLPEIELCGTRTFLQGGRTVTVTRTALFSYQCRTVTTYYQGTITNISPTCDAATFVQCD